MMPHAMPPAIDDACLRADAALPDAAAAADYARHDAAYEVRHVFSCAIVTITI